MNSFFKKIKKEFFYLRKSTLIYKQPFHYIINRWFFARQIFDIKNIDQPPNNKNFSIHILTCRQDIVMLLWSLKSFYQSLTSYGQLYIHSDGSLNKQDKQKLYYHLPHAEVIEPIEAVKDMQERLRSYPAIQDYRFKQTQFVLLKKLIDPYFVGNAPYKLIIDSDLLYFKPAQQIAQAIETKSDYSWMMYNTSPCYVYFKNSTKLDDHLARLNSGIVLYHKNNFSLDELEIYFKKIDKNHPQNKHFIEQAGYAYILKNIKTLPQDKYIIKPALDENTIVKHYTSPRRPLFYIEGITKLKNYVR